MRKILVISLLFIFLFPVLIFAGDDSEKVDPFKEIAALYFSRDEGDNFELHYTKLNELLKSKPNDGEVYWRISRYHYWKGKLAKEKSKKVTSFEAAQKWAEKGIAKDPKNPEVYYWSGVSMGMIGNTKGVLKSLFLIDPIKKMMNKTVELNPDHSGAHHVLGVLYRKIPGFKGGSNEKSVKELLIAIKLKSTYTLTHYELALTYIELKQEEKAKVELKKVLDEKNPSDPIQAKIDKRKSRLLYNKLSLK